MDADPLGLHNAVISTLQSLLSQAYPLAQQLSNITATCNSIADDVAAAQQCVIASVPEVDASTIAQRKKFLDQLSGALSALLESQKICQHFESSRSSSAASHIITQIILAARANARALAHLDLISSGPYADCGAVCSARAHHRLQVNAASAYVKMALSSCVIKESAGSGILLSNDCCLLNGLQVALLECAPSHVLVLVDAIADAIAKLFSDEVFQASMCITQQSASNGILLRASSLKASIPPNSTPAVPCRLSSFADSLSCVASAVCASMPCSAATPQPSLSESAVTAIVQRACHKLCLFAANCAGDFAQAQTWSKALQQLPPHAEVKSSPAAAFWDIWADKRSVDAVNATQQLLLQINSGGSLRERRNAAEYASAAHQP